MTTFIEELNSQHNTIRYELNYSYDEVNFLDTTVYIDKKQIHCIQNYILLVNIRVKNAIPYSQGFRLRRIIDDDSILRTELQSLKHKFLVRGYPQKLLNSNLDDAVYKIKHEDTIKYKTNKEKQESFNKFSKGAFFLPFILTDNISYERAPTLKYEISKEWPNFLENNEALIHSFQGSTPQIIYKRSNTLQNMLIHTKHIPVAVD